MKSIPENLKDIHNFSFILSCTCIKYVFVLAWSKTHVGAFEWAFVCAFHADMWRLEDNDQD